MDNQIGIGFFTIGVGIVCRQLLILRKKSYSKMNREERYGYGRLFGVGLILIWGGLLSIFGPTILSDYGKLKLPSGAQ